jgi:hypothetical protein
VSIIECYERLVKAGLQKVRDPRLVKLHREWRSGTNAGLQRIAPSIARGDQSLEAKLKSARVQRNEPFSRKSHDLRELTRVK